MMVVMASITVRPEQGRLLVFFPYSPERVAKIKTVPCPGKIGGAARMLFRSTGIGFLNIFRVNSRGHR